MILSFIYIFICAEKREKRKVQTKKREKKLKKIVDNKKNLLYNASEKGKGVFET